MNGFATTFGFRFGCGLKYNSNNCEYEKLDEIVASIA